MNEHIYINDHDIADYNAKALRDSIKIGGTKVENDYFKGRNRTHYTLMATTYGLKTVGFTLVFFGQYVRQAKEYKSMLEAEMVNGCEIQMPDGFYYRCMLDSIGEDVTKGVDGVEVMIECAYKFSGIQHDQMETIDDGSNFYALGTMPKMDCQLQVTVGASASNYTLGGVKFGAVTAGDVLVVDGIYKRFLKNGAPVSVLEWLSFPSVTSGLNQFTALDTVKVTYYPCYI